MFVSSFNVYVWDLPPGHTDTQSSTSTHKWWWTLLDQFLKSFFFCSCKFQTGFYLARTFLYSCMSFEYVSEILYCGKIFIFLCVDWFSLTNQQLSSSFYPSPRYRNHQCHLHSARHHIHRLPIVSLSVSFKPVAKFYSYIVTSSLQTPTLFFCHTFSCTNPLLVHLTPPSLLLPCTSFSVSHRLSPPLSSPSSSPPPPHHVLSLALPSRPLSASLYTTAAPSWHCSLHRINGSIICLYHSGLSLTLTHTQAICHCTTINGIGLNFATFNLKFPVLPDKASIGNI